MIGLLALIIATSADLTPRPPVTVDFTKIAGKVDGAVKAWQPTSAAEGVLTARLVGSMTGKPGKSGNVLFAITPLKLGNLDNRSELSVRVRVSPPFVGEVKRSWQRPHRARLLLEDALGRRMMLPSAPIVDRPKTDDGWLTLVGRPTSAAPIPLGFTDRGFDIRKVTRIGVNVEAWTREGEAVEGTIEVRGLSVRFLESTAPFVVGPVPEVHAGEAARAKAMEARFRARTGLPPRSMAVGVNLAWPTARSPQGEDMQLYGRILDGGTAWWGRLWDVGEPAVHESVRADFRGIRELFGKGAIVRVWLFGDLRAGFSFDEHGFPRGVTDRARGNLRKLLDLARAEGVVLIPVLFDFGLADGLSRTGPDGAWQVGERPALITSSSQRAALGSIVEGLVREVAGHEAVLAWEPMNEPENAVDVVTPKDFGNVQRFLAEMVEAIHRAGELATVGSRNGVDGGRFLRGRVAADLGQAHYYPLLETRPNPSPFGLDMKPLYGPLPAGWGEFQAFPGKIVAQLRTARAAGHRYALFWSWRGHMDNGDGFAVQPYAAEIKKALAAGAAGPR